MVRYDDLSERGDLVEAQHMVPVVVEDAGGAIDLHARVVTLHDAGIAVEEALRVSGVPIQERLSPHHLREILPSVVAGEQAAMEAAEQKVGAARADLTVAVEPRGGIGPGRKLQPE